MLAISKNGSVLIIFCFAAAIECSTDTRRMVPQYFTVRGEVFRRKSLELTENRRGRICDRRGWELGWCPAALSVYTGKLCILDEHAGERSDAGSR